MPFFEALRSRSSNRKQSISNAIPSDAHSQSTHHSKDNTMKSKGSRASTTVSSMQADASGNDDEKSDFQKFLEKAKKDAEREERKKIQEVLDAERRRREANMSPWAGRM
ncbi:hypothetical protein G7Y89_g4483 [Cudoniella acicularis]|uniref:Uncharacterized protein n=1 Tax=Cudoniella acicularis TaxID=354080 RepID=A0A8H4RQ69_9HELO|nr:hypothetical protein G7Y89_g4483 [Cudoniella acicularis]